MAIEGKKDKIFNTINVVLLFIISLIFLLPFLMVLVTSVIGNQEYLNSGGGLILFPKTFDFTAYKNLLFDHTGFYHAFGISLMRTVIGTTIQLFLTSTCAYALSKNFLPGRNKVISLIILCLVIPMPLIPQFLLVKSLGLIDSFWAMILPWAMNLQFIFIMKAFFNQIPESLEDAASIDGCTHVGLFVRIILPLSMPSIATIGLFYAVWHWNQWFDAAIFLFSENLYPVQTLLNRILITAGTSQLPGAFDINAPPAETYKSAAILIVALPMILLYPFIQRFFVKGFMVGGVKG